MAKRAPKRDRVRAAVAMLRALLDAGDAERGREIAEAEALKIYDGAHAIANWAKTYMPHLCRNQRTGEAVEFAEIHYTLYAALLFHKRVLAVLPRGFGKSTICTLIYPLYLICEKRARYVMLGSYAQHNAQKFLRMVREELETNARIRADYGNLAGDEKWTDELFITADNVMVEAIYFGKAAVRGSRHGSIRPECVILDDLETKEEARNPERVEALVNWVFDEVTKLYFDVQVVVVGTILEDGSAIHRLMETAEALVTDDAIGDPAAKSRFRLVSVEACDENFSSLAWPWYFDADVLRAMYEENPDAFNQEMRHLPRSRKTQAFHTFAFYRPDDLRGHPLRLTMYVDLIPGVTEHKGRTGDTDYFAYTVLGRDALTKKLPVMEACHERDLTKEQMIRKVLAAYVRWVSVDPGLRIVCEDLAFQAWFRAELAEIGRDVGLYPPVDGAKPRGDKHERILSIDYLVNGGTILFLENDPHQRAQREELKHLRSSRYHDDLAETLWGCVNVFRGGAGAPVYAETPASGRGRLAAFLRSGGMERPEDGRPDRERLYAERAAGSALGGF